MAVYNQGWKGIVWRSDGYCGYKSVVSLCIRKFFHVSLRKGFGPIAPDECFCNRS